MSHGRYSFLDRAVHRLALSSVQLQLAISDVENLMFRSELAGITITEPIFVTGLPRSGTTLLLTLLSSLADLASLTYRDMPFVLTPLMWRALSKHFRRRQTLRERSHRDGMTVGFDSPEAFEEVLWLALFRRHYASNHIELWPDVQHDREFQKQLCDHMRKVIAVRREDGLRPTRYISKNNLNIARLGLLLAMYPTARIVIPFREPLAQSLSCLDQHTQFLELHSADTFAKRYMSDLGHFDFGAAHRPIAFAGYKALSEFSPTSLDYWLCYWTIAYRHALNFAGKVAFVDYAALTAEPAGMLSALADFVACDETELVARRHEIRPNRLSAAATARFRPAFLDAAQEVYGRLRSVALSHACGSKRTRRAPAS